MKFEAKKIADKGRGVWNVTIDGKEWEAAVAKGKKRATANIQIPGFRKGKAPADKVQSALSPSKYLNEALKAVLEDAWEFAKTQESDIQPFTSPMPAPKTISEKSCTIEFSFDLKPEIKIGKYKGLTSKDLKKESFKATKEEIEQAIDQYRERFAMEKIREDGSAVAAGDVVKFDFEGFVDGAAFPEGKGTDFILPIGSGRMIPGFEDQMIGKTVGESTINVVFQEDYTPELSGKAAEFKLNIKEIKERTLPAKDDELAKDLDIKGVSTIKELEKYVTDLIEKQKGLQMKNAFVNGVIDEIRKTSTIELPKVAIDKEVETLYKEFEGKVMSQKLTMKEYKKQTGLSDDDIKAELFEDAKKRLESFLITDAVRNEEKFEVSDKEIDAKFQDLADQFGMEVDKIKDVLLQSDQVKEEIIREKIVDFLYDNNGAQ